MACEEKVLLELRLQLRKPYNEAETLIDAFNQIIEEGGRAIISVSAISPENPGHNVLQLNLYRCRNSYTAASLGAKIINKLSRKDFIDISNFNFASVYSPTVHFSIKAPSVNDHGPIIIIKLFENSNPEEQEIVNRQFELTKQIAK